MSKQAVAAVDALVERKLGALMLQGMRQQAVINFLQQQLLAKDTEIAALKAGHMNGHAVESAGDGAS